ncbi:MAG TPA: helix-turn-helix domain-containing protein [Pyrinomonadaceae bacterium]
MQHRSVMTWKEAAYYLRVSTNTLRTWVDNGKLTPARIGERRVVFLKTELDRFLAESMKKKTDVAA